MRSLHKEITSKSAVCRCDHAPSPHRPPPGTLPVVKDSTHDDRRLRRVAEIHRRPEADRSLSFLEIYFKREVEKPYRQVAAISEKWQATVPQHLLEHCRLTGISRGVLRVGVDTSAHLYELDRLLRSGLEKRLVESCRHGLVRRVQLRVENSR